MEREDGAKGGEAKDKGGEGEISPPRSFLKVGAYGRRRYYGSLIRSDAIVASHRLQYLLRRSLTVPCRRSTLRAILNHRARVILTPELPFAYRNNTAGRAAFIR